MLAVTEYQTCKGQTGRLVGISASDAVPPVAERAFAPVTGRLLLDRCVAQRENGGVHLSLAGRGWTSVHTRKEVELGALFAVDGLVVFSLAGELSASVRVAGSPSTLSVWLQPTVVSGLQFGLIRRPNVRPLNIRGQAGRVWTSIVSDYEGKIVASINAEATERSRTALEGGFTATVDLCTAQPDSVLGALDAGVRPRRPYADDGSRWLANERVLLDGDSIDFAGPFDGRGAPVRLEMDVEGGSGIAVRVACVDQVRGYVDAWIQGRVSAESVRRDLALVPQASRSIQEFDGRCPLMLVTAPLAPNGVGYRFRVGAARDRPEALVRCGGVQ